MDCLRDYIGIKGCGSSTPLSDTYLNVLSYINSRSLTDLVNSDHDSVADLFNDIQDRAILRFSNDLIAAYAKKYQLRHVIESVNLNRNLTDTTFAAIGTNKAGFTLDLRPYAGANYQYSALTLLQVESLSFFASITNAEVVTEIAIYDLDSGVKLWSKAVTIAEGWNSVNVGKSFSNGYTDRSQRLFCCINSTDLLGTTKNIDSYLSNERFGSIRIQGATSDASLTITSGLNTHGLTGVFSQKCSFGAVVCNNKEVFKSAWLYCLGYEYQQEALDSDVLSGTTTIHYVNTEQSMPQTLLDYKAALKAAVDGFELSAGDICLECAQTYQLIDIIP